MSGSDADRIADRIMGLEESALFSERRIEELHEQVLALSGRVEMLTRRFARLERVVLELGAGAESGESDASEDGEDTAPELPG